MRDDPAGKSLPLRFRRYLDGEILGAEWPAGFSCRTIEPADVQAIHSLMQRGDMHGSDLPGMAEWWSRLSRDSEFDPALCFVVIDADGRIGGVAQCWTSSFLKDLAVHPECRRRGIGLNLLRHVFGAFRARGAPHLDLKVDAWNGPAIRLYERAGMQRVPLGG